jgi:hypothetical protein
MSELHSLIKEAQNTNAPVYNENIEDNKQTVVYGQSQPKIVRWVILQAITITPIILMALFFGMEMFSGNLFSLFITFAIAATIVMFITVFVGIRWFLWLMNDEISPTETMVNSGLKAYEAGSWVKQVIKQ